MTDLIPALVDFMRIYESCFSSNLGLITMYPALQRPARSSLAGRIYGVAFGISVMTVLLLLAHTGETGTQMFLLSCLLSFLIPALCLLVLYSFFVLPNTPLNLTRCALKGTSLVQLQMPRDSAASCLPWRSCSIFLCVSWLFSSPSVSQASWVSPPCSCLWVCMSSLALAPSSTSMLSHTQLVPRSLALNI